MDLQDLISIQNVTIKEQHLQLSKQKVNMKGLLEFVVDTQIFSGNLKVHINKGMETHLYFH